MRTLLLVLVAGAALAQAPAYQPVGNMSQLMVDIIYPASDAVFYIGRTKPKNDVEWNQFKTQALMLAESGNLLLMPGRARDQEKWVADTKLMIDVAKKAYKLAQAKNLDGILDLNDELNTACVTCHKDYRPNYGRPRQP